MTGPTQWPPSDVVDEALGVAGRLREGAAMDDEQLLMRALGILHRMATEQTGWRRFLRRWYYSDEPLRNDAANLVREAGFGMAMPAGTALVGDDCGVHADAKVVQ